MLGKKSPIVHSPETLMNNCAGLCQPWEMAVYATRARCTSPAAVLNGPIAPGPSTPHKLSGFPAPPGWPCIAPTGHSECSLGHQVQGRSLRWVRPRVWLRGPGGRPFSGSLSASAAGPLPNLRRSGGQLVSSVWPRPGAVTRTGRTELMAESQTAGGTGRVVTHLPIIWRKTEVQSGGARGAGLGGGSAGESGGELGALVSSHCCNCRDNNE